MIRQSPSIFNDIVGPIMVGPSSSHTCAPSRIGFLSQQLLNGTLRSATIEFAKKGAYTSMYKGQKSDLGFINGLLGNRPEDTRLRKAYKYAEEKGIKVEFVIKDFEPIFPNITHLTLENDQGENVIIHADSTGGGTVKLLKINGFDVEIVGDCYELLIQVPETEGEELKVTLENLFDLNEGVKTSYFNGNIMINIKRRTPYQDEKLDKIKKKFNIINLWTIDPILVVASNRHCELPFESAEELLKVSNSEKKPLWKLGIEYEMERSGWKYDQVWDHMKFVIETMESGVKEALKGDIQMNGIIGPTAGKVDKYIRSDSKAIDMGVLNTAVPWAMATMEYSSAMGVVLCAPTGGSAGVFPGAVLGIANELKLSVDEKIKAMFSTSIIGIVMSKDNNYSAELFGCQVEPGAASGMAAGALVEIMGGTPKQSIAASSCAVQNILGTICDPVAGLVQIPCINRNAMSVANAVVSANMIMGGFDPLISLDQVSETMFRVGRQLPSELRCTCQGGLCITSDGQRLALEQEERDNINK